MNTILKRVMLAMAALMGVMGLNAGMSSAATQKAQDACPAPFTNGYSCMFQPATVTNSSHTKIVIKKSVTERVKQFEKATNVIASINMGSPMKGSACMDPTSVQSWGFNAGDSFKNADRIHRSFMDTWRAGWLLCNWHLFKDSNGQWWAVGIKANCRNTPVYVPVRHKLPKPTKQVLVFTSVKSFESTYEKWATSTSSTTYSCKAPFTLTYVNGKAVCFIATQIPVVTPPSNPPTVNCPTGTTKNSQGQCIVQTVTCSAGQVMNSAGNCVAQSNAAELNCQQSATAYPGATVHFDNNTLTCTITQVIGNCSNIVVIQGNGSPVISQQGNCNTTPPPSCTSNCSPPPAAVCVTITSIIDLNDVPVGKTSGNLPFAVNSCGAGSVTVDPGNGGISKCDSNVKLASVTFDLATGNNSLCVIYYAPLESSVTSGSITYTAIQGSAKDVKSDTFAITHPVRP
jgi:hypothetical protein